MAHYVVLAKFTGQGIRGIKATSKRAKAARESAKSLGATIRDIYWTLGAYDVVLTMEAPSDEVAAALMMKWGALGNLTSQTLRAFSESEIDSILAKV